MNILNRAYTQLTARTRNAVLGLAEDERGDVPGWVLVTLMTAGIVTLLWVFAGPALVSLFDNALQGVTGP